MKKVAKITTLLSIAIFSTGCATIVSKSEYPVNIQSNPSGASFVIKNRDGVQVTHGITPQTIVLKAGAGYFRGEKYEITFTPQGKKAKPQTFILDTDIDGWYIGGNLLFGGLIGYLIVDPISGAMFKLPEYFYADLNGSNNALNIISIDTLTAEQRSKLEPINL